MNASSQIQFDQFMAALSAAEHVTAASPVAPYRVSLEPHSDWGYVPGTFEDRIGVHLHFRTVDEVREFAKALRTAVAERARDGGQVYSFADGVLNEVPFRAWALTAAESPAVAA